MVSHAAWLHTPCTISDTISQAYCYILEPHPQFFFPLLTAYCMECLSLASLHAATFLQFPPPCSISVKRAFFGVTLMRSNIPATTNSMYTEPSCSRNVSTYHGIELCNPIYPRHITKVLFAYQNMHDGRPIRSLKCILTTGCNSTCPAMFRRIRDY